MSLQVTVYRCGICDDYNFDQSIMCKRHMTEKHSGYGWRCQECRIVFARQLPRHKNCQGELELINRTTMTCTREEKEAYEGFQRNRGDKVILVRMSCGEKMSLTNDQRSRSHIKGKVFKNVKMSPKKRAVLENVYRPMKMNFGEKSWCRDQEKKEEFRRPTQITPVKILPVTPVKIPAAAGKAHEEPSKTVGPAGDSLYQSQREEKKLMVDSEASSTSSEKGEISIMEEGEFSDDDDDDDMNGLQDNSGKKDNDTNEDRMKVTEVVDITEISSSKTEHIYTATPTRILKLGQIDKGQKTRFMFNIGGVKFETCANTINNVPDSVLFELINTNSTVKPYLVEGRSTYFIDRDPKHFSVILNYLRNGGRYHSDMLPRDLRQLKELQVEAAFYELKHLELNIQRRILDLQHGHFLL